MLQLRSKETLDQGDRGWLKAFRRRQSGEWCTRRPCGLQRRRDHPGTGFGRHSHAEMENDLDISVQAISLSFQTKGAEAAVCGMVVGRDHEVVACFQPAGFPSWSVFVPRPQHRRSSMQTRLVSAPGTVRVRTT